MIVRDSILSVMTSNTVRAWTCSVVLAAMSGVATVANAAGLISPGPTLGQIAFIRDGNVWVSKADAGDQRRLTTDGSSTYGQGYLSVSWLRGTRVAFLRATGRGLGRVGILDIASGKQWLVPGVGNAAAVGVCHKQNRIGYLKVQRTRAEGLELDTTYLVLIDDKGKKSYAGRLFSKEMIGEGYRPRLAFSLDGKLACMGINPSDASGAARIYDLEKAKLASPFYLQWDWWKGKGYAQPMINAVNWVAHSTYFAAQALDEGEPGIYRVEANRVARIDSSQADDIAPVDASRILFTVSDYTYQGEPYKPQHWVWSLDLRTGSKRKVLDNASSPTWVPG